MMTARCYLTVRVWVCRLLASKFQLAPFSFICKYVSEFTTCIRFKFVSPSSSLFSSFVFVMLCCALFQITKMTQFLPNRPFKEDGEGRTAIFRVFGVWWWWRWWLWMANEATRLHFSPKNWFIFFFVSHLIRRVNLQVLVASRSCTSVRWPKGLAR